MRPNKSFSGKFTLKQKISRSFLMCIVDGWKKMAFTMKPKYRGVKPVVVNMKLLIKFKDYLWMLICGRKSIYQFAFGNVVNWIFSLENFTLNFWIRSKIKLSHESIFDWLSNHWRIVRFAHSNHDTHTFAGGTTNNHFQVWCLVRRLFFFICFMSCNCLGFSFLRIRLKVVMTLW